MKKTAFLIILIVVSVANNLFTQTKVIEIWQGNVPGAIKNSDYDLIKDSTTWIFMRHITKQYKLYDGA